MEDRLVVAGGDVVGEGAVFGRSLRWWAALCLDYSGGHTDLHT